MFEKSVSFEAVEIPFNWNADYIDGSNLSEYDTNNKKNDFYAIDKDKIVRFGLFGQGVKYFYENSDGSFNISGRRVEIVYEVDGKEYYLGFGKKDPITYKSAYADYNNRQGAQKTHIESIHFGYKTSYERDDIQFFFQAIVGLSSFASDSIEIKMSTNRSLEGDIVFKVRGKEIERFKAPVREGVSGQMSWTIK